jgi:type I restriction enzyme, S subunit
MIDKLQPYPAVKDSGVEWLGEVPEHWHMERAKWLFRKMERPFQASDEVVTCFRDGIVTLRRNRRVRGFTESLKEIGYQGIHKGDLVIHAMDAFAGAVGVADSNGKGTPVYSVCEPANGVNAHFYAYLVRDMARSQWVLALAKGIRERSTDFRFDSFAAQAVPVPPPDEQSAIVRFLDYADRRIRRYIRSKQNLINLLEEQKQVIIHQAVTRGLDPSVPLKPSGIPWIGAIPARWEVLRGKYLGRLFSTPSVLDSELTEDGVGNLMYLKVSDLVGVDVSFKLTRSKLYVRRPSARNETPRSLLVFPKRGGAIYTNRVAIIESPCLLDPNLMGWEISNRFDPQYVALLLKTRTLADLADVSSVPQINNHHINPIPFPAPPVEEQRAIVVELSKGLVGVNTAISRLEREISLLREYRTRLVADVVTGKRDVRCVAAKLPDEPEKLEPFDTAEEVESAEETTEDVVVTDDETEEVVAA